MEPLFQNLYKESMPQKPNKKQHKFLNVAHTKTLNISQIKQILTHLSSKQIRCLKQLYNHLKSLSVISLFLFIGIIAYDFPI